MNLLLFILSCHFPCSELSESGWREALMGMRPDARGGGAGNSQEPDIGLTSVLPFPSGGTWAIYLSLVVII